MKMSFFHLVTFPEIMNAFKQLYFVTSISLIIHKMVTPCQNLVKQHSRRLKLIMETIIWMRSSIITTIFTLDIILINYSWMMTSCQTIVNLHQIGLKVATRDVIGMGNPYMTTIFNIDLTFVNYSWNNGHLQYWLYLVWKIRHNFMNN